LPKSILDVKSYSKGDAIETFNDFTVTVSSQLDFVLSFKHSINKEMVKQMKSKLDQHLQNKP